MNLILQAVRALLRKVESAIPKKLSDLVNDLKFPVPNWGQNDPEGEGYVKNRPFYAEYVETTVVEEQTVSVDANGNAQLMKVPDVYPDIGSSYTVIFDGVAYNGTAYEDGDACMRTDFTTKDGISVTVIDCGFIATSAYLAGEHTIKIVYTREIVHAIDAKFLPSRMVLSVNNKYGHVRLDATDLGAASASSVALKMDKSNPSGTGSFSLNRKYGSEIGQWSVAMGYEAIASGRVSFVHGDNAKCVADNSFALGPLATVSDVNATSSVAVGRYALSRHKNQFVCGIANEAEDSAFIVGIGTSQSARKNGFTISRDGDGWFRGTIDADALILRSTTEGSAKKFKITVDDSGTIAAVEVTE